MSQSKKWLTCLEKFAKIRILVIENIIIFGYWLFRSKKFKEKQVMRNNFCIKQIIKASTSNRLFTDIIFKITKSLSIKKHGSTKGIVALLIFCISYFFPIKREFWHLSHFIVVKIKMMMLQLTLDISFMLITNRKEIDLYMKNGYMWYKE